VSEKNADSAADTNATITNNTKMVSIAKIILTENDFIIMLISGNTNKRGILLVRFKIKGLN
jgi:hypothetical protein